MVARKFLLVLGQSNATAVADAPTWEDEFPTIRVRSPLNLANQVAGSAYQERFTMPGTFAGARQTGRFGDGPSGGIWQTVDTRGLVINAIRFLTFYNPTASYLNVGTGATVTYPGTGSLTFGSLPNLLNTSVRWQYNPTGLVITRTKTGTTHTLNAPHSVSGVVTLTGIITTAAPHGFVTGDPIYYTASVDITGQPSTAQYFAIVLSSTTFQLASSYANAIAATVLALGSTGTSVVFYRGYLTPTVTVSVDPPFSPPPSEGETFTYTPTGGDSSITTELKLVQMFGGLHDIGSAFDVSPLVPVAGQHDIDGRRVLNGSNAPTASRIVCRTRPGYVGAPVAFSDPIGLPCAISSVDTVNEKLTLSTNLWVVGSTVSFIEVFGTVPSGITPGQSYYVVFSSGSDIQISAHAGGTPINLGAGFAGVVAVAPALPPGITAGTTYYISRYATELEKVTVGFDDALDEFTVTAGHGLINDEKVRWSGQRPVAFAADTDYFVTVVSNTRFYLSATRGGAKVTYTASFTGTEPAQVERQEAYFHFFISATVGGTEIVFEDDLCKGTMFQRPLLTFQEAFRGSLTGLQVRALTGSNAGQAVPLADVYYSGSPLRTIVKLGAAFGTPPSAGDTYAIEVPPLNGKDIPFTKWAHFLPWCPFEGRAVFSGPYTIPFAEFGESAGAQVVVALPGIWPNEVVRFYTNGTITSKVRPGQRYYTTEANTSAAFLAASYQGATMLGTGTVASTGGHAGVILRQENRVNPFPPGFNHPNHYVLGGGTYQPFDGPALLGTPKITFSVGLAVALADYYGEQIDVVQLAVGGTNIGHTEAALVNYPVGSGTFDAGAQLSWSPTSDVDNIFSRLLDVLDAAVLAWEATGDTGECIGIVWLQGEGDASFEHLADRYLQNGRRLKTAIREAVKERGLFSRPAKELKWIDPHCESAPWTYAATVNAAKDTMAAEDSYSVSGISQDDLPRISDLPGMFGVDPIHHNGEGMALLGRRVFDAMIALSDASLDVEIANLALSIIGEPAKVFSLDPLVDQSTQAAECAKFFESARDTVLESFSWAFATVLVELTATTLDDIRSTEWAFAYALPADFVNVIEVMPPGTVTAAETNAELTPWWRAPGNGLSKPPTGYPYKIERSASGALVLFTNVENAVLRYVRKVTAAVTDVPMKFKMAVARKLAAMIAGQFVKGEAGAALAQRLEMMARGEALDAAATDGNRRQNQTPPTQMPWNR